MKQIRQSIFETNSSSSHTFSVCSINNHGEINNIDWENKTLIVNLNHDVDSGYDDGKSAGNITEKLLIILYNNPNITEESTVEDLYNEPKNKEIIQKIEEKLGIEIVFNCVESDFRPLRNYFSALHEIDDQDYADEELFDRFTIDKLVEIIIQDKWSIDTIVSYG